MHHATLWQQVIKWGWSHIIMGDLKPQAYHKDGTML
jgi:hypothetical protein